jgi:hypothetical protein
MSVQSDAGKQAWQQRAGNYDRELRERIEQRASARFERWRSQGRFPLWFRAKRAAQQAWARFMRVPRRSGGA